MHAMILAAGRGERLRPLTDTVPKPLIDIGGRPLIARHLETLAAAGFREIVINLAWRGAAIEEALGDGAEFGVQIAYSREPEGALETAGGIRRALELLGDAPFLVINGDILTDYPLADLHGREPDGLAHLVLVDNPDHHPDGDFHLDGRIVRTHGGPRRTFAGIGVYRPELFTPLAPGRHALAPLLVRAMSHKQVHGEHYRGMWLDVGTPERLAAARRLF